LTFKINEKLFLALLEIAHIVLKSINVVISFLDQLLVFLYIEFHLPPLRFQVLNHLLLFLLHFIQELSHLSLMLACE
jgi:hypothetical protein